MSWHLNQKKIIININKKPDGLQILYKRKKRRERKRNKETQQIMRAISFYIPQIYTENDILGFLRGALSIILAEVGLRIARSHGQRRPLFGNHEKVCRHCFPEALFVLLWGNYGGRSIFGSAEDTCSFYPCLQVLVPCILPHKIDYSEDKFVLLLIDTHQ